MLNLIMTNCPWDRLSWGEKMLKTDGYSRLMEVNILSLSLSLIKSTLFHQPFHSR